VLLKDGTGAIVDNALAFIDLDDPGVSILDNWHVAGMAGSGSNMIVAEGLFVPEALLLRASRRPPAEALYGLAGLEPRDLWPMEPLFPLGVLAPMLGAAEAMLEMVAPAMGKRAIIGWNYAAQSGSEVLVGQLGEAAMLIDSAWMHIRRAAAALDEVAQTRPLTGFEKARVQADCGHAMGLLRQAGERLMDVAGPGAFALSNPLQRFWRDLSVGARHNALNTRLSLELYGRALCGKPSNLALLADPYPPPAWAAAH